LLLSGIVCYATSPSELGEVGPEVLLCRHGRTYKYCKHVKTSLDALRSHSRQQPLLDADSPVSRVLLNFLIPNDTEVWRWKKWVSKSVKRNFSNVDAGGLNPKNVKLLLTLVNDAKDALAGFREHEDPQRDVNKVRG
jgi:hypothetical protein